VVFYNDENNKTYRLKHVDDNTFPITTIESLHRAMCVSKYAPEIIEGEIIGEDPNTVRVKIDSSVYVLQKMQRILNFGM